MIGKSMMKNAYLPKISILLRFGVKILALLRPDDSIQILLILPHFQTFGLVNDKDIQGHIHTCVISCMYSVYLVDALAVLVLRIYDHPS